MAEHYTLNSNIPYFKQACLDCRSELSLCKNNGVPFTIDDIVNMVMYHLLKRYPNKSCCKCYEKKCDLRCLADKISAYGQVDDLRLIDKLLLFSTSNIDWKIEVPNLPWFCVILKRKDSLGHYVQVNNENKKLLPNSPFILDRAYQSIVSTATSLFNEYIIDCNDD